MSKKLADLLFPDISVSTDKIFSKYPKRQLPEGAMVTRIAPSPTGQLHIGTLYAAFISWRLAKQSNGVFYIRIEDTDGAREVKGVAESIIAQLNACGIAGDEGCQRDGSQAGDYGPYVQSERRAIYQIFAKDAVSKGLAYPCFCDKNALDSIRATQKEQKIDIGYYGSFAQCCALSLDNIKGKLRQGMPYVIRFKSNASEEQVVYDDLFKGRLEFPAERNDTVIIKADGLPTYHFAHCVDDTLMGTTHVLRGDEWVASLPLHRQLFQAMGFPQPVYGHIAPIVKMEGTTKRKYSKRRDLDGLASYFLQKGYPLDALHEYFLTLANSTFEEWRIAHPAADRFDYPIDIKRFSASGAILDQDKLRDICKNIIAAYSTDSIFERLYRWAEEYDRELFDLLHDTQYAKAILSIGRNQPKPRKDIDLYSNIKNIFGYFFDDLFAKESSTALKPDSVHTEAAAALINRYLLSYDHGDDKACWFDKLKSTAADSGFCIDKKTYQANREAYQGTITDAAALIRIALTNRMDSPDLYDVQQVMGEERVRSRLEKYLHDIG